MPVREGGKIRGKKNHQVEWDETKGNTDYWEQSGKKTLGRGKKKGPERHKPQNRRLKEGED